MLGRRADGYHELESLVAFADLADELRLEPAEHVSLEVSGPFASACGAAADNLVLKAARELGLPAGRFTLQKNIPVAAGLGGGSADAAAALRLIARANGVSVNDRRIAASARSVGADVWVCLESRARVMAGIGDELSRPIALPKIAALLVNPGVPLPTHKVFATLVMEDRSDEPLGDIPGEMGALLSWLAERGNDLTRAATTYVPAIGEILAALPGCRVARMSGSGPTCFGLFDDTTNATAAAEQLAKAHGNWWICATTIG